MITEFPAICPTRTPAAWLILVFETFTLLNIIFSIEINDGEEDCKIQVNGRFMHNPVAVEKLLIKYGFCDIYKENLDLRMENSIPVKSMIFKALGVN